MGGRSQHAEKAKAFSPGTKAMKQVANTIRQAKRRAVPELNQHDQQGNTRRKRANRANNKGCPKPKAGAAAEGAEAEATKAEAEAA